MPVGDATTSYLLALACSRMTYNVLSMLREAFGNDLDAAQIAFAMVLRTWPDHFHIAKSEGNSPSESSQKLKGITFTLSIYELAKVTGLDRASVRRKLFKLETLGFVLRQDDGTWGLVDFKSPTGDAAKAVFSGILRLQIDFFEETQMLGIEDLSALKPSLHTDFGRKKVSSLSMEDIYSKMKKT